MFGHIRLIRYGLKKHSTFQPSGFKKYSTFQPPGNLGKEFKLMNFQSPGFRKYSTYQPPSGLGYSRKKIYDLERNLNEMGQKLREEINNVRQEIGQNLREEINNVRQEIGQNLREEINNVREEIGQNLRNKIEQDLRKEINEVNRNSLKIINREYEISSSVLVTLSALYCTCMATLACLSILDKWENLKLYFSKRLENFKNEHWQNENLLKPKYLNINNILV
ncbi:hypothetical protein RhiirA5_411973 [Rhizophagus irregularis]|uniref:Uncharacterized protein n=1 Tax=Rhizophagus irregularis TaxID=588596 RepID=A0A2N0PZU9_9GLOM|nr:hypothetical protein RhiirA5_411973 [Rhizophagus irregularis]PKC70052.1 hypothetical protein RhiirA1_455232 [Rhizophagus irregularis]CAB4490205.1 unnamed protein product [Rhizophagus irregularis]CAB5116594.1 unnamed protein product [Rhizophagus irregularis]